MSFGDFSFIKYTQGGIDKILTLSFQGILFVTIICLFVPFSPAMPAGDLDPSWAFGMNQAMAQGMAIGRDVAFTFGPYASIYTRAYHPATDHLMFIGSLYLGLSYASALFLVARKSNWFLVVAFWLFLAGAIVLMDSLFFSYPLLVGVLCIRADSCFKKSEARNYLTIPALVILLIPFGLLPLIKGSFLLICGVTTILIATLFALKRKWIHVVTVIVSPIVATLIFWRLSGQAVTNFPSYFKSLLPIISGYTEAMASDGNITEIYLYLVAGSVLLFAILFESGISLKQKTFMLLTFGVYLFIAFKSGFVRHDGHALIAAAAIMIASFVFSFTFRSSQALFVLAVSFSAWLYIDQSYVKTSTASLLQRLESIYTSTRDGAADRLAGNQTLKSRFHDAISILSGHAKFPLLEGTTDIYSYNQSFLIASGNTWNPRPVFQSYSAYTPSLALRNKGHLLSEKAPDNIIFRVEPIDGRIPSIEDGASWPVLLSHYDISGRANGFLYLSRNSGNLNPSDPIFVGGGTHSFGDIVSVPSQVAPVFVEISLKPSFLGKLVNVLYKPSQLSITLNLRNGSTKTYRLISGMASSGFVLSPLIENSDEFGLLYGGTGYLDDKVVKSFSITPSETDFGWNKSYEVSFNGITLNPRSDISKHYEFNSIQKDVSVQNVSLAAKCDGNIDVLNGVAPSAKPHILNLMKVQGWLAKSAEEGAVSDSVLLVLRDGTGKNLFINTRQELRPDVGAYFKKPRLEASGFAANSDVASISGDYNLGLAYVDDGHVRICPQFNFPVSIRGANSK